MSHRSPHLVFLGILLCSGSCYSAGEAASPLHSSAAPAPPAASEMSEAKAPGGGGLEAAGPDLSKAVVERRLIYSSELELKVKQYAPAEQAIKQKAEEFGGYVAETSAQRNWEGKLNGTINVRVPAKRFREALDFFGSLGEVTRQREWTQDVTEEYLDVQARIANKRALERRLLGLLAQKTAKLADLVAVEEKLAQVRAEIEQAEGRMRYLKNRIAFSAITVSLFEPSSERADEESVLAPLSWAGEQMGRIFFGSIGVVLLIVVGLAPWAILAYVIVKTIIVLRRRKKARQD